MGKDPDGTIAFLGIFITAIVGAAVGGVIGGLTAAINGKDVFAGVLIGAASGAIMGATAAIAAPMILAGGATMVTGFEVAFVGGFIAGFGSDVATKIVNENESINLESAFYSGFQYGVLNMVAGGIGAPFAYVTETSFNVVFNLIFTTQISLFGLLFDVLREKL